MDGGGGAGCIGNDGDILSFPKILHIKTGCTRTKQATYWACEDKTAIFLFFVWENQFRDKKISRCIFLPPLGFKEEAESSGVGPPSPFFQGKVCPFRCVCVCVRERERTGGCIFFRGKSGWVERDISIRRPSPQLPPYPLEREKRDEKNFCPEVRGKWGSVACKNVYRGESGQH